MCMAYCGLREVFNIRAIRDNTVYLRMKYSVTLTEISFMVVQRREEAMCTRMAQKGLPEKEANELGLEKCIGIEGTRKRASQAAGTEVESRSFQT